MSFIGNVLWLIGGGGGGTVPVSGTGLVSVSPPIPPQPKFPGGPPPQIPEPPSLVLLVAGVAPVLFAVRRRRVEKAPVVVPTTG